MTYDPSSIEMMNVLMNHMVDRTVPALDKCQAVRINPIISSILLLSPLLLTAAVAATVIIITSYDFSFPFILILLTHS
jgi:hypothetical protein